MELIDTWNINGCICKGLHNARIITLLRVLSKLLSLELGKSLVKDLFSDKNSDVFKFN